ncbi:MAG: penicillin-binding protein 2 [Nitrospiraceae bacterium]|nr:penicillin-binding protein 2 [Nitrospiraceae bacterium]
MASEFRFHKNGILGSPRARLNGLIFVFWLGMAVVIVRLYVVQVIKHHHYLALARDNVVKVVPIPPLRGEITDRNGVVLVRNGPDFAVFEIPGEVRHPRRELAWLAYDLGIPANQLRHSLSRLGFVLPPHMPVPLETGLSMAQVGRVNMDLYRLPGFYIQVMPKRIYPPDNIGAHLLGYVGSFTSSDLKGSFYRHLPPGTGIGKSGIEKEYDALLQGAPGLRRQLVDSHGRIVRNLRNEPPKKGRSLRLTIDMRLQMTAERFLGDRRGAVVALDPRNGEILALASHPSYSSEELSQAMSSARWKTLVQATDHPLTDRAVQGLYPPGSVFKIVTTLAGLSEHKVDPDASFHCAGTFRVGSVIFHDWKRGGHGTIHLHKAIEQSCDIFFYHLGMTLGPEPIARVARLFGLGSRTGIDLPAELSGVVPDREWKRKYLHTPWYPGETPPMAIGQGYLTVTPLEMARLMGAVAMNGQLSHPHLLLGERGNGTGQRGPDLTPIPIPKKDFDIVRADLRDVVAAPHGTGHPVNLPFFAIAGKTGTAQVVSNRGKNKGTKRPKADSWFVGFGPFDDPRIVVAVLIENGGDGGDVAGPVAREVFRMFYITRLAEKGNPTPAVAS